MDDVEALLSAAHRIEEHGWFSGDFEALDEPPPLLWHEPSETLPTCAVWAIDEVTPGERGARRTAVLALARHLGLGLPGDRLAALLAYPVSRVRVMAWNDAPGRTKEEVVATLRDVALDLILERRDGLPAQGSAAPSAPAADDRPRALAGAPGA